MDLGVQIRTDRGCGIRIHAANKVLNPVSPAATALTARRCGRAPVWTYIRKINGESPKPLKIAYTNNNQHRIVGHRNDSGTFASSQARNINDKCGRIRWDSVPWHESSVGRVMQSLPGRRRVQARRDRDERISSKGREPSTRRRRRVELPNVKPQFTISFGGGYFADRLSMGYQIAESAATMQQYYFRGCESITEPHACPVSTYNVPIGNTGEYDRAGHITGVPIRYHAYDRLQNIYLQDKWTPTGKLVSTWACGFEVFWMPWMDATCRTAKRFSSTSKLPGH